MVTPVEGLDRLRAAADSELLDEFCARHRVRILTVFGSAARRDPEAADIDIGIMVEPGNTIDYPTIVADLTELTDANVDLVHLNRGGPVIRERALVGSVVLFESEPGAWASASTAAALERMDTAHLRRLDLELLAQ